MQKYPKLNKLFFLILSRQQKGSSELHSRDAMIILFERESESQITPNWKRPRRIMESNAKENGPYTEEACMKAEDL